MKQKLTVPFVDLAIQYQTIKDEIDNAISDVIRDSAFIRGVYVDRFEAEFSKACGAKYCISCGNGTDAIYITLKALDIGEEDEVITTALSWIATSEAITQTGARVVFADVDEENFTIDPFDIERKITKRTKAIIPVHLYGQPADMEKITALAKKYDLAIIEDCAQAHFAEFNKQKVGTFGVAGTFSFYPGKNLGAFGDAGAIISNNEEFSIRARKYANHGSLIKHKHEIEGINSRMDGIQAAILSVKLKYLQQWNDRRILHAKYYNTEFQSIKKIRVPKTRDGCVHVYHQYVIRVNNRDDVRKHLNKLSVGYGIHYPVALPFLKAYEYLGETPEKFPIVAELQKDILSLPIYPELTFEQKQYVRNTLEESLSFN